MSGGNLNSVYTDQFLEEHGIRVKFPSHEYIDWWIHPYYKDHIVVLSRSEFNITQELTAVTNIPFYKFEYLYGENGQQKRFIETLETVEEIAKQDETHNRNTEKEDLEETKKDTIRDRFLRKDNSEVGLIEETKGRNTEVALHDESNQSDYEGGDSESDKNEEEGKLHESSKDSTKRILTKNSEDKKEVKIGDEFPDQILTGAKSTIDLNQMDVKNDNLDPSDFDSKNNPLNLAGLTANYLSKRGQNEEPAKDEEEELINLSNRDEAEPILPKDEPVEEEKPQEIVEEQKPQENLYSYQYYASEPATYGLDHVMLKERYNKLSKKYKQMVIDMVVEKERSIQTTVNMNYQGYSRNGYDEDKPICEKLAKPGYSVPDIEKPNQGNADYSHSEYYSWTYELKLGDVNYIPPILKEKLQISLWKVDSHGIVKTKDRYFSIKHPRFGTDMFGELTLLNSLDGKNIIV